MSYDISLYRIETKEKEQQLNDEDFFEKEELLVPFTKQQFIDLKERLLAYDYEFVNEDENGLHFNHPDEDFGMALLTDRALYFNASWNDSSIFETGLVASEFTYTEEFAKYDPQNEGWEEI